MFELKPLRAGVDHALEKAQRYRLLNEPGEAESICLDVLSIEPSNQEALVTLLLALTDQFEKGIGERLPRAREVAAQLGGAYEKAYYNGVISERRGKAILKRGSPGAGFDAYDHIREAMEWFEKADALRPHDNDDATLRWNACARKIMTNADLRERLPDSYEPAME